MNWDIARLSIPVFDLEKSSQFYSFLLNDEKLDIINTKRSETEYFLGGGNIELKLYQLTNDLKVPLEHQSRRTFPSLFINNLNLIIENLKNNKVNFITKHYNKSEVIKSIIIQDPGLNFIELFDLGHKLDRFNNKSDLLWNFHHINLECYDVRSSVAFIAKNLNIKEGNWKAPIELGKVNIEPNQLAIFPLDHNHSGIHINKADFKFSWRNRFIHNPTIGGHPAFNVKDIKGLIKKLEKADLAYTDAKVYAMPNIHQIYLFDPNANIIEINQNI